MATNQQFNYEVKVQTADDGTDDVLLPIPTELLAKLGWHEGDSLDFNIDDRGRIILRKLHK